MTEAAPIMLQQARAAPPAAHMPPHMKVVSLFSVRQEVSQPRLFLLSAVSQVPQSVSADGGTTLSPLHCYS